MFNAQEFKSKIQTLSQNMQAHGRGKLPGDIESKIIAELSFIFLTMADRAKKKDTLEELLQKMELDFSRKFSLDVQHDVERDVEIGKIKFAFLDGVRRALTSVELQP